jgi:hypothetical protein
MTVTIRGLPFRSQGNIMYVPNWSVDVYNVKGERSRLGSGVLVSRGSELDLEPNLLIS